MGRGLEIHLVDSESGRRTDAGRMFAALGCHTEAYADLGELLRHPPREGIIIAHQAAPAEWAGTIRYALDDARIPLPLILASETVDTRRVVGAMAAGAFDYLALPLEKPEVAAVLERALELAGEATRERRRMIEARMRMSALSAREREVLELLITGASNKVVARMLAISPRTVEIHRANMMVKLRVNHVAGAVRLHFEARAAGRRS